MKSRPFLSRFSGGDPAGPESTVQELPITERPFFFIVSAALAFIYAVSILQSPSLQTPSRFIPYTALMLLYAALFWVPLFIPFDKLRTTIYLVVQASLAFILSFMIGGAALVFGLIAPLLGLAIGMIHNRTVAAFAIVALLGQSALAIGLSLSWGALGDWVWLVIPMTVFIIIYVVLYTRQAEAREQAQQLAKALETANAELATYASQVEELTLTAERQRMARELHDTLAQGVAGLILQLEAVNAHLENDNPQRAQAIIRQAMERARNTLAEARQAIDDLRQAETTQLDLAAEIKQRTQRFSNITGIPCHVDLIIPTSLSQDVREQVLRMLSEALSNIAHHAEATDVWVRAHVEENNLMVEVRDNGMGFDTKASIPPGHYGLLGIKERTRLVGGSVDIQSTVDGGTTLSMHLPLDNQHQIAIDQGTSV